MEINEPKALLAYKLSSLLAAERQLVEILPKLQGDARDTDLANHLMEHLQETREQVANLEQAFKDLKEKPEPLTNPVIQGLEREYEEFTKQQPDAELRDAFLAGAAAATEYHEKAAYESAITLAESLHEEDVVSLLEVNLSQEEKTLAKMKSVSQRLIDHVATPA